MEQGTGQFATDVSRLTPQEGNEPAVVVETTNAPVVLAAEGGNAEVDADGNPIVAATNDSKGGDASEAETTIIDSLRTTYGVETALPNDVTGLSTLIETVSTRSKAEGVNELYTELPQVKEYAEHLKAGKSPESFHQIQQVQAQKLNLQPLTGNEAEDVKITGYYKQVITANLTESGLSEKQIGRVLESAELEGTLEEDYKEAVTAWNARVDATSAQISQKEALRVKAIQDEEVETVGKINTLVEVGTIGATIIPVSERADFKKFLLEQDNTGLAGRDKKIAEMTLEQSLVLDYILFKDFKVSGFNTKPVQSLEALKNAGERMQGGGANASETSNLPASLKSMNFNSLTAQ